MKLRVQFVGNGDNDPVSITYRGHTYHLNARAKTVDLSDHDAAKMLGNSHFLAKPVKGKASAEDDA